MTPFRALAILILSLAAVGCGVEDMEDDSCTEEQLSDIHNNECFEPIYVFQERKTASRPRAKVD